MRFLSTLTGMLLLFTISLSALSAQQQPDEKAQTHAPQLSEEERRERYANSMSYMLRRAALIRTLSAEHLLFIEANAEKPDMHLIEEASQVIAFDLVCTDEITTNKGLHHVATESTYKIAALAGKSPIVEKLSELGQQQAIRERMNMLGDIATTVFMYQVGRRRGLFDSLIADFGETKFCDGMRDNMRDRYNTLTANMVE